MFVKSRLICSIVLGRGEDNHNVKRGGIANKFPKHVHKNDTFTLSLNEHLTRFKLQNSDYYIPEPKNLNLISNTVAFTIDGNQASDAMHSSFYTFPIGWLQKLLGHEKIYLSPIQLEYIEAESKSIIL